jgi:hypothetical protein
MAVKGADRLYSLLPAVYREQDADNGFPLRGVTSIVGDQLDLLEQDVARLWSDLFIETCRTWVIPYIGDLVSNNLLFDGGRGSTSANELFTDDLTGPDLRPPVAIRTRADVAKTIYYRRRKGTLPMLEELARDVTGWPAHAVEFFELLGWTQHLEHHRPQACWFDVRSHERDERVDGAFDEASHTVDVAPISTFDGWHSIKNVGFFLWRLVPNRLLVDAGTTSNPWGFTFSPLGNPAPLFIHPRREDDETGLSTQLHVPGPILRAFFSLDLRRHQVLPPPDFTDLYGLPADPGLPAPPTLSEDASLYVIADQTGVAPADVRCRRLDTWPATRPAGSVVWIDPQSGRLALGAGLDETKPLRVSMTFGFPAALGGGSYERRAWLARRDVAITAYVVRTGAAAPEFPTVAAALSQWQTDGRPNATVRILDSRTYALPAGITLSSLRRLTIEAANDERPLLRTRAGGFDVDADAVPPPDPEQRGGLTLCGPLVEGFLHVIGDVGRLRLLHTTIVPGRSLKEDGSARSTDPSIVVEPALGSGARINARLRIQIAFSVCGPIECPDHVEGIWLLDSIVDGLGGAAIESRASGPAAPLHIERATILGRVEAHELDASEAIFTGRVDTARTQAGCVRFSFVPRGSRTPKRYRCQPDLGTTLALREALAANPALTPAEKNAVRLFVAGWLRPSFVTTVYGRPEYCQLSPSCPLEIRTGAEDGSEMGAYCHLKQPQRESNLRIRLGEYLPFGLDAGVIYVT